MGEAFSDVALSERLEAAAIAGVVDRPRLYRILDSPLVRVCVVQGPSGSGKTTLLRSWALQPERREFVFWVSIGPGFTTRAAFWRHVAASAARHGDLPREEAAKVEEQLGLAVDPARIARTLLAGVGPVVMVLDAYEHLAETTPEVDADLARILAAVPELRVMITTRGRTELADFEPPGGGIARVVSLGELALTTGEVGALIAAQTGIADDRLAQSVTKATRGFPLTVRAVVLALSQLGRIPRPDSMEWDEVVAAKLESLLPGPVAVQFVTDTSVPPYVDVDLAEQLSGNPNTMRLLEMLERNGFGRWVPYARDRPVFQYVETIRDAFRMRAADDADRFRSSCVTTALWLLENEEVADQALHYAIEGGDFALADRVFVSVVVDNPDSYITSRFLATLRRVPEAVLCEYPMLAFGLGLALMASPVHRLEAPHAFRIAIDSRVFPSYLEPSIDAFSHAAMRAISLRLDRRFRESAEVCLEVLRMADAFPPELRERFGEHIGTILRQMTYSIWLGGDIDEALATIHRSIALCARPASRNYSVVYAAGISAFAGDTARTGGLVSSIDTAAWPAETRDTSLNGLGLFAEAYARLDALDFAGAAETLLGTRAYMATNEYWPFHTAAWVWARTGLGEAQAEAERVTRELAGAMPPPGTGDNVATENLYGVLALSWMASGDHRAARRLLDGQPEHSPYLGAARVHWLLGSGRDREALHFARASLELPGHTIRTRAETQTAGAVAALRQGDAELAWSWLSAAVIAWETSGARMHVVMLEARDRRALRELGERRGARHVERYLDVPRLQLSARHAVPTLTPREGVVLTALVEHEGIRPLAGALFVSPHTVKSQLQSIYRKLGVSSRAAALSAARELGLLEGDAPGDEIRDEVQA